MSKLLTETPKPGDLSVWWIPQVPMKAFRVSVPDLEGAKLLLRTLAAYDQFQLDNNIRPDYSNAGGLSVWEDDGEGGFDWCDWYNEDGDDIDDLIRRDAD